jgi:mono/diheme cytochrome c family protein
MHWSIGLLAGSALAFLLLAQSARSESRGDAKLGKIIYVKNCVSCHGQKGDGLSFRPHFPNFADAKIMAAKTDQELFDKISNGGKGTGMPAWKKVLSERDRWNVLAYLRTLSNP